jgi:hypothetical protein
MMNQKAFKVLQGKTLKSLMLYLSEGQRYIYRYASKADVITQLRLNFILELERGVWDE